MRTHNVGLLSYSIPALFPIAIRAFEGEATAATATAATGDFRKATIAGGTLPPPSHHLQPPPPHRRQGALQIIKTAKQTPGRVYWQTKEVLHI